MKKLILIILILFPFCLNAAQYYISTTGNNGNTGLSEGQSWATFAYSIGASSGFAAQDTLIVVNGDYSEAISLNSSAYNGIAGERTLIIAQDRFVDGVFDPTVSESTHNVVITAPASAAISLSAIDFYHFVGIKFIGGSSGCGSLTNTCDGNIFQQCRFVEGSGGNSLISCYTSCKFVSCLFDCPTNTGVHFYGIDLSTSTRDSLIFHNCTFNSSFKAYAISCPYVTKLEIKNCIINQNESVNSSRRLIVNNNPAIPLTKNAWNLDYNIWYSDATAKRWRIDNVDYTTLSTYRAEIQTDGCSNCENNSLFQSPSLDSNGVPSEFTDGVDLGYGTKIGYYQEASSSINVIIF